MEKRTFDLTDPLHFAISVGSLIMVVPCFYWLGIFSAALFEKAFIVKALILPDTQLHTLFNVVVLVGLPVITLLLNIQSRLLYVRRDPKTRSRQLVLMLVAGLCMIGAFRYTFFDRMDLLQNVYL